MFFSLNRSPLTLWLNIVLKIIFRASLFLSSNLWSFLQPQILVENDIRPVSLQKLTIVNIEQPCNHEPRINDLFNKKDFSQLQSLSFQDCCDLSYLGLVRK